MGKMGTRCLHLGPILPTGRASAKFPGDRPHIRAMHRIVQNMTATFGGFGESESHRHWLMPTNQLPKRRPERTHLGDAVSCQN